MPCDVHRQQAVWCLHVTTLAQSLTPWVHCHAVPRSTVTHVSSSSSSLIADTTTCDAMQVCINDGFWRTLCALEGSLGVSNRWVWPHTRTCCHLPTYLHMHKLQCALVQQPGVLQECCLFEAVACLGVLVPAGLTQQLPVASMVRMLMSPCCVQMQQAGRWR